MLISISSVKNSQLLNLPAPLLVHHGPITHILVDIQSDIHQIVFSLLSWYGLNYLKERSPQHTI